MAIPPCDLNIDSVHTSNKFGKFIIKEYLNNLTVRVEFIATGYVSNFRASHIRSGKVRDPLLPTIFGVGFHGEGIYSATNDGKVYDIWISMLARCYCEKTRLKLPSYNDCTVDEEWHSFQSYAEWYYENLVDGFQVDKDIKIDGNRVYSSKSCLFVSAQENSEKSNSKKYIVTSPSGKVASVFNLSKFCRENGLHAGHMSQGGYKGWSCAKCQ